VTEFETDDEIVALDSVEEDIMEESEDINKPEVE
jgi:hypothetical protein